MEEPKIPKSKHTTTECHWQFRDPKTPARVCYLLRYQKITATDLLICWMIDALVKSQGDEDGIGAFPSNKTIGNAVGSSPTYVSERLAFLENLGLLIIIWLDGVRYLETEWSRTTEERKALRGKYGKLLRQAYITLQTRVEKQEEKQEVNESTDSGKPEGGFRKNGRPPLQENLKHNLRASRSSEEVGSNTQKKDSFFGNCSEDEDAERAAKFLKESLRAKGRQVTALGNKTKWATSARLFRDKDGQDLWKILRWFGEHCSREDQEQYSLPAITNFADYRKLFGSWIEPAYHRARKKVKESGCEENYQGWSPPLEIDNGDGTKTTIPNHYEHEDYPDED